MTAINLPFAAGATRRAPTSVELAEGYGCGDADLDLFNWMAWWLTGQVANATSKSGLSVDDSDLLRFAKAIRSQALNYVATVGGSANALTATLDPAPAARAELIGAPMRLKAASAAPGGAVTLNVGPGAFPVKLLGADPLANAWLAGDILEVVDDGAKYQLISVSQANANNPYALNVFNTPGAWSYTVPAGVYWVDIDMGAAGGGGSGADGTADQSGGGGGQGGTTIAGQSVIPGDVIAGTIGAPGAGGAAGSPGAPGGSTTCGVSGKFTLSCAGGAAGAGQPGGIGGSGTGAASNSFGTSGNSGHPGRSRNGAGVAYGGNGAPGRFGGSGTSNSASSGGSAAAPNAGGAGGARTAANTYDGGAGGAGFVIIRHRKVA
jgi:hypothetical protein